jgi:16S rRNA (guanine1516-N2)-methyltransferase
MQYAVCVDTDDLCPRAREIADRLRVDVVADRAGNRDFPFLLCVADDGLSLLKTGKNSPGALRADFTTSRLGYRRQSLGKQKQPIARAVGLKHGKSLSVVDATAGLGVDSFLLAALGCQVTLLERSSLVFHLLADGVERARRSGDEELQEIIQRMHLVEGDATAYLKELDRQSIPDVVYLDPMFPGKKNKALPKKEMQYFQALLGEDTDNDELLAMALDRAKQRVVVKRPTRGDFLAGKKPAHSLEGKTTRFDIYPCT